MLPIIIHEDAALKRKPPWLKIHHKPNPQFDETISILKSLELNTVCAEANCPNCTECFSNKTATFMILGTNCTRNCRFCNVSFGPPTAVDASEPEHIAKAVKALGLEYVVITSVTRDDLADGGASHFASVIQALKKETPNTEIEVLIPDFGGDISALKQITGAIPLVVGHNMETVPALYEHVRPQANYRRSLDILREIKVLNPKIYSKTGIMLGLGETKEQVELLFDDLRDVGCDFLTIGQYLAPSKSHFPVCEYITPEQFEEFGDSACKRGFSFVMSAPLVRSSYHAKQAFTNVYV